jgi:hypothetical protein
MFNPRWLIGRKIVRVDMNRFDTGRKDRTGKKIIATDPVIHFDNGAYIDFSVQETEGDYGIAISFHSGALNNS